MIYRDPTTGNRKILGGSDRNRQAAELEAAGWVRVDGPGPEPEEALLVESGALDAAGWVRVDGPGPEPEEALLVESGALDALIVDAKEAPASSDDWEGELDALMDDESVHP